MWDSRSYTRRFSQAVQSGEYHQLNTLRVAVFTDTVEHIKREQYLNQRGKTVLLPLDWRLAKESVLYTKKIEDTPSLGLETLITVVNADCLAVAQEEQDNPLVLNMANPHTPGGGVEGGAGAQEEHLFRSSNYLLSLYSFDDTLAKAYGIPRAKKSYPLCDAYGAVYSPKVTVFRGREKDGYPLLDQPYKASFIALPAIYGPPLIKNKKGLYEMEEPDRLLTKEKIRTLLKVAKNHNHQTLILSAMGCGAFCNPPNQVASLFREVLQESPYRGSFAKIIFAITDDHNTHKWYNPEGNYAPFAREFKKRITMIQVFKLSNKDIPKVYEYIKDEPEVTLLIQGDLELYGLQSPNVTLYAIGENWDSILLKYYSDYVLYSKGPTFNTKPVASLLARQEKIVAIKGKESLLLQMKCQYPKLKVTGTYLCRCDKASFIPKPETTLNMRKLTKEDASAVVSLYQQIEEFAPPYLDHTKEKLAEISNNLAQGGVALGIFEGKKLLSSVYTTATTKQAAMVVGVATLPEARNRGYASALVSQICSLCFESGLEFLCLYFDNPTAGAIYQRLGFEVVDRWATMRF